MSDLLRITGGKVYDPANVAAGDDGQVRDVLIAGGKVVAALPGGADAPAVRAIDAAGCVVMPGGVDVHCHIASASVNRARAMQGEEHASHVHRASPAHNLRSGTGQLTPSTFLTGYRYAGLGYTTAVDAAVAPCGARHAHLELDDTPNIDAGFLLLVANHQRVIELIDKGDQPAVNALIAHMVRKTGALGIKVVNPGGVASWRNGAMHHTVDTIDSPVAATKTTPRRILEAMAAAAEAMHLAHPPHVHANRLGLPGNAQTTLDTLAALDGRRVHLTHLQFHAYGQTDKGDFTSAAAALCDYINAHKHVTADAGMVAFGDAFTLTADTPLEHMLWQLTGLRANARYTSIEAELETGCGLMPITYRDKHALHSLQWAIGLELMLGCDDPWRMLLSTDHPNGGSFMTYPRLVAALMSKPVRDEQLARAHRSARQHTGLAAVSREFTLRDVAIVTRAGPARVLGLTSKGHLGPGADADVTIYDDAPADPQRMFQTPRIVIKAGRIVVDDAELRQPAPGARLYADVAPNEQGQRILADWFARHGSYDVRQFGLHDA